MEEETPFDNFEGMSLQDILQEGQKALFISLVNKVRNGQANHQELAILRNLLRDNGLVLGIPAAQPEVTAQDAPADLPSFEDPDYE